MVVQITPQIKGVLVDTDKKETQITRTSQSLTHNLFLFSLLFYSQSISVLTCFLAT